ncbi:Regulator of nucleoside diphosphate kinase [Bosea sp. 62]|nr:Regulator of nucleoside diphosphate kinase [Bosea sp. 46]CAD5250558.1 Regulator of nucleoside diphosphate kinase [Bosea sp. 21B]CAD5263928.1 Regulator of nucleoside diphosphate kinase [Bosea sp. 7B]VVT44065.1 Regulator of nucleoside diphosphate kinase [Bosea sp. EC-HK365B]VXB13736.1 Regulator of nucleoside diphosphate kinase [Bosea sp. 29B]VXB78344.1 Regulator of nucleoside diphosphate kinase [Bosea sp. 62]VXC35630.1 Regulator of nucleoside diphosphate kinase [Bosea sp. 125]VXC41017.1 Reg
MTQLNQKTHRKPKIIVGEIDHERLTGLATTALERIPEVAEELLAEMDRAKVVPPAKLPADVVRMGSFVTFDSDSAQHRRVQLVYPGEADIEQGRISVLTPIGAALIGLAAGQSIAWTARDGKKHVLTVTAVEQPAMAAA